MTRERLPERDAALMDLLGRCLGLHTDGSAPLDALVADEQPWPELIHRASAHLVTPSLTAALADAGLLDRLPEAVRDYLEAVRTLNRLRNDTLYQELQRIATALNADGIEPQLFKGAAALLPGQYPGAADRVIGDLDLGLARAQHGTAAAILRQLSYGFDDDWRVAGDDHQHGPSLLHPDKPVRVELHHRPLCDRETSAALAHGAVLAVVQLPGTQTRVRLADPGTRLLHNFLHVQFQDRAHARCRLDLRQLLDFARMAAHHRAEVDWTALAARLPGRHRDAFRLYLASAEHWLGLPYPPDLGRSRAEERSLRRIERGQSSRFWSLLLGLCDPWPMLRRIGRAPLRLLSPSWCRLRLRALRRGRQDRA